MARKSVKCIEINGISGGVYGATVMDGRNTVNGQIAAYGDTLFSTAASPVLVPEQLALDILDEGAQQSAILALVGKTVPVTITTSYGDGTDAALTSATTLSGNCVVLAANGDNVPVDDYGRSLIHVTLVKQAD